MFQPRITGISDDIFSIKSLDPSQIHYSPFQPTQLHSPTVPFYPFPPSPYTPFTGSPAPYGFLSPRGRSPQLSRPQSPLFLTQYHLPHSVIPQNPIAYDVSPEHFPQTPSQHGTLPPFQSPQLGNVPELIQPSTVQTEVHTQQQGGNLFKKLFINTSKT